MGSVDPKSVSGRLKKRLNVQKYNVVLSHKRQSRTGTSLETRITTKEFFFGPLLCGNLFCKLTVLFRLMYIYVKLKMRPITITLTGMECCVAVIVVWFNFFYHHLKRYIYGLMMPGLVSRQGCNKMHAFPIFKS